MTPILILGTTLDGRAMRLSLPTTTGDYHLSIPLSPAGLEVLRRIIVARESLGVRESQRLTIGTEAAPTQALITEWLRTHTPKTSKGGEPDPILDELKDLKVNL